MKVGDYVRTKKGMIAKYIGIDKEYEWYLFDNKIQWFYEYYRENIDFEDWDKFIEEDVVKSNPNIIDLIEVGDYVNGCKITSVYDDDSDVNENNLKHKKCLGKNIYDEDYQEYLIYEEDIKSIVTKEQFESMEYRIGE